MSNEATLLQHYIALNWAREIVGDIDRGAAKFIVTNDNGLESDKTLEIREQQLRVIEILDELIATEFPQKSQKLYSVK